MRYVLVFPVAFAAGMSLLDTVNAVIMLYTYEWARLTGKSRDIYNAVVTGLSVVVAFLVGTAEWIQVVGQFAVPTAPVVAFVNRIDFEWLGVGIVAVFLVCFLALARRRTMSVRIDDSL